MKPNRIPSKKQNSISETTSPHSENLHNKEDVIIKGKLLDSKPEGEIVFSISRSLFSGPLPPPETLIKYNTAYSKAAEVIIECFRKQVDHRMSIENKFMNTTSRNSTMGVISAALIGILGVAGGVFLLYSDKNISGFSTIILSVGSLVGIYLYGKNKTHTDIETKKQKK
ncbi:MAG: DUF2335 domain-containing protein [Bacteroidota bacterium]|nr:DUF2335 domain-containing protein [Bacteroidota bacterium]